MGLTEGGFFMEWEEYAKRLRSGKSAKALEALTQSEAGAKLAAKFDGKAVEQAARSGDGETLSRLLQGILATPEGQDFARQVQKAVEKDGR
jgi:hypothetical protein